MIYLRLLVLHITRAIAISRLWKLNLERAIHQRKADRLTRELAKLAVAEGVEDETLQAILEMHDGDPYPTRAKHWARIEWDKAVEAVKQ